MSELKRYTGDEAKEYPASDPLWCNAEEVAKLEAEVGAWQVLADNVVTVTGKCPKCGAMMAQGYVCFGCGYDRSEEEENND